MCFWKATILLTCWLIGTPAFRVAGQSLKHESIRKIDELFAQWNARTSPGCAVAVVLKGQSVYQKCFGEANLEDQIPVTADTVFDACSVAKEFTALAVQLLVTAGKCQLDDPLVKYVPEMGKVGRVITLRQLLHHTSGIRDAEELACALGGRDEDVLTTADALWLLTHQHTLNFEPGTQYLYSNSDYILLALVVQRLSGRPVGEFIRDEIFTPLGMSHSRMLNDHSLIVEHRAESYKPAPGGGFRRVSVNDGFSGDGGLFTTISDMERWDKNFDSQPIGGRATLDRLIEPGVLKDGTQIHYASGLVISKDGNFTTIGHNGGAGGYRETFLRFPEQRLSVILLANASSVPTDRLARRIAEIILDNESSRKPRELPRQAVQISPSLYDNYVGEYYFENGLTRVFRKQNDRLIMVLPDGKQVLALPCSDTRFFFEDLPGEVEFLKPEVGMPRRIRGYLGDQVFMGHEVKTIALNSGSVEGYLGNYYSDELQVVYRIGFHSGLLILQYPKGEIPFVSINSNDFKRDAKHSSPDYGESLVVDTIEFVRNASSKVIGFNLNNERLIGLRFCRLVPQ